MEQDEEMATDCTNKLREEYGPDFKANDTLLRSFLDKHIPADALDDFKGARMGDGTPVFSSPAMVKALTQVARIMYPTGTTAHGAGMDNLDTVENEIAQIKTYMKTNRESYYKDEKKQARYRELLEIQERFSQKK
jgi:hypothetical protein